MPDHLHFLCEGVADDCNLIKFVEMFKQCTNYEFKKRSGRILWQKRYYDHVLRPKEAPEAVVCYIWWNPVRKNLCCEPQDYPLSGSQTMDWMTTAASRPTWKPEWR